ncbi:hypothetical protein EV122DRAFT_227174, partial [Schizophyllum commune]
SKGRLVLSYVWSHLSVETMHALLCLNSWVLHRLMRTKDVEAVAHVPDVKLSNAEPVLEDSWDSIKL